MATRKYQLYLIQIDHSNGSFETIEYTKDYIKLDKTCYKTMLDVYRDTKENYKNTRCVIKFLGIAEDEKIEIFSKQFEPMEVEESTFIKDDVMILTSQLENMISKGCELKKRKQNYNVEMNRMYHEEFEFSTDLSDEHKIKAFDMLKDLLVKRRQVDCDLRLYDQTKHSFDSILGHLKLIKEATLNQEDVTKSIVDEFERTGSMPIGGGKRVYKYENFKQRMNLMKQLSSKYGVIENDEENKNLICSHIKKQ